MQMDRRAGRTRASRQGEKSSVALTGTLVCIRNFERPRRDTNGESETEVTVKSNKQKQKEQRDRKENRKEKRRTHPLGARAETRCQKTSSVAGARGSARPRARAADDLSAVMRMQCG